ncbi:hypothetical protein [Bacillus toyonensis]|nr:hypothetical protein [Bacillus toyonensis]
MSEVSNNLNELEVLLHKVISAARRGDEKAMKSWGEIKKVIDSFEKLND